MGSIVCSVRSFIDTIIDIVGIKSGLVLTRKQVLDILKIRDKEFDFKDNELENYMRIRSETYEDQIRYVRIKIGDLKQEASNPFRWIHKLTDLNKSGVDTLPIMEAMAEVAGKYPHQRVDPDIIASEIQDRVPKADYLSILKVLLIYAEHQHEGHNITKPEEEEWDGGTPLSQLFNCELKSDDNFMDQKFLNYIAANTDKLEKMHWRNFERFCAEFFDRLGYAVKLGPGTNDNGVDIRAFDPEDDTKSLIIIQCKRYKKSRKVAIETVKAFYTDVEFEGAQSGMIITTSEIAPGGKKVCEARKYKMDFAELAEVRKWAKAMGANA